MKIYVSHSSSFDFKREIYEPIRHSELNTLHDFILPHEVSDSIIDSKEIILSCDLIIAEVSYLSTGMGIELGWANNGSKKILCLYKKGVKISRSLRTVSTEFIEYKNPIDFIEKIKLFLHKL